MMDKNANFFLVLADNQAAETTKGALQYLGFYNVQNSKNVPRALEALLKNRGDILISDHASLKGTGAGLLQAVRTHPELSSIKTIMLTTTDIPVTELKQLYLEGINSVLRYPFHLNDLQKTLTDIARSIPSQVTNVFSRIRQLDFFSYLDDNELLSLLKMTRCRKYDANEIIFDEGQPGDRFYVVIEGKVSIVQEVTSGKENVLARLEKGACFGEMAVLENSTRSARARAAGDVLLFELDSRLMDGYDDIITLKLFKKLVYIFSERLRSADHKIRELSQSKE